MKRNVFLGTLIALMLCLSLTLCGSASLDGNISADETEFVELVVDAPDSLNHLESVYSLRAVKDILGNDGEEGNVELLYNANDEAEYILTTAEEGGYAIFHRMTGSLMEAGEFGASPYAGQTGKKYYFGPSNYAVEGLSGSKTDIMRGGEMTEAQLTAMHRNMAEIRSLVVERSATKNYSSMLSSLQTASKEEQVAGNNSRNIVDGNWVNNPYYSEVEVQAFTEIEHSEFYKTLTDVSQFGDNSHGSCKFVSTVLLLRYYDMFVAPSLIPNESIPEVWKDVCDSAWDVLGKNKSGDLEYYDCSINEANDSVYEALHKYLIAEETKTGFSIFGTHGYSVARYNNSLPNCINVDNTTTVALTDNAAFNQVKSLIDTDNPVAIHITYTYSGSTSTGMHVVVAYGYLETENGKYYKTHFGWGASTVATIVPHYFVNLETNYLTVTDNHTMATAHNCTNSGVVSGQNIACFGNEGHNYYPTEDGYGHACACGDTHLHSASGIMEEWPEYSPWGDNYKEQIYNNGTNARYNEVGHFCACEICLEKYVHADISDSATGWLDDKSLIEQFLREFNWTSMMSSHRWSTPSYDNGCTTYCIDCGYVHSVSHGRGEVFSENGCCMTRCLCGYEYEIPHVGNFTYVGKRNFHITTCLNCSATYQEQHAYALGIEGCVLCGYGAPIGGGIIIKGVN